MAKQKDIGKWKEWGEKGIRKLEDDYTGFPVYSNDTEVDYQGRIVKAGTANEDPIKPRITPRATSELPFYRPFPQAQLLSDDQLWEIYWDTYDATWDDSGFIY